MMSMLAFGQMVPLLKKLQIRQESMKERILKERNSSHHWKEKYQALKQKSECSNVTLPNSEAAQVITNSSSSQLLSRSKSSKSLLQSEEKSNASLSKEGFVSEQYQTTSKHLNNHQFAQGHVSFENSFRSPSESDGEDDSLRTNSGSLQGNKREDIRENRIDRAEEELKKNLDEYNDDWIIEGGTELFASASSTPFNRQPWSRPACVPPLRIESLCPRHFRDYGDTLTRRDGNAHAFSISGKGFDNATPLEAQRLAYLQCQMREFYDFLMRQTADEDYVDLLQVIVARFEQEDAEFDELSR